MYSDDEVLNVVDQLVRSSVRRDYDDLGVRRTDTTFSDIQEVAASVFLLYSRTPQYLAYLAANKIRGNLASIETTVQELLTRIAVLRRRSLPVNDLSSLVNAKVALFELETAGTSSVQNSPAYKRFDNNLARFLDRVGSNVKLNGDIVPTPEQARTEISSYVTTLNTQATELERLVQAVTEAVSNYNQVDLAKYGKSVITNARTLLDATITSFAEATESGKLALLRDAVLKIAAMRGVVRDYGTFLGVSPVVLTGTASPFSDSERAALGATLECQEGPYKLVFGTKEDDSTTAFRFTVDASGDGTRYNGAATSSNVAPDTVFTRASGSFLDDGVLAGDLVDITGGASVGEMRRVTTVTALTLTCTGPALLAVGAVTIRVVRSSSLLYLQSSIYAKLEGQVAQPFVITAGTNDNLEVSFDGGTTVVDIPLTAGTSQLASDVVADIDAVLNGYGFKGEAYFSPLYFEGVVNTSGNDLSMPFGNFPTLFSIGDEVDIYFGPNATTTRTITALSPSPTSYNSITVDGGALLTSTEDRIRVGPAARKVRIVPMDLSTAIDNRSTIKLVTGSEVERNAGFTLGLYGELTSYSRPTDAEDVATYINRGTSLITASTKQAVRLSSVLLRTDTASVLRLVAYKQRTTASYGSGTNVTFTLDEDVVSGVVVGDEIAVREGYEPGTAGVITAVGTNTLTANMLSSLTAASGVLIEVGPTNAIEQDDIIEVDSGVNAGRYYVDIIGTPSFDLTLRGATVPQVSDGFNQPLFMTGSVYREALTVSSKSKSISSSVESYDNLGVFFDTTGFHRATATTQYLQLPTTKGVEEGDLLELYTTGSVTPDITAVIETVFDDGVVGLAVALDATVSYTMAEGRPQSPPSAVLRKEQHYNFDAFKDQLDAWLAKAPWSNLSSYFTDLNRYINPLLVNENPTDTDVSSAENRVKDLSGTLTIASATIANKPTLESLEAIFDTYSVNRVHEIDAMLKTLQERGADRASDLLLECQFTTFFGLSLEEVSYGGAFQKAMRDVMQNDLPVSKVKRAASTEGTITAEVSDADFEFSAADMDESPLVDPPVDNPD